MGVIKLNLNPKETVCFMGLKPREMYQYNKEPYQKLVDATVKIIFHLYHNGYRNFITSGYQGFDQCVFWAIHKAKLSYPEIQSIVCTPYSTQTKNWRRTGLFSVQQYELMLKKCDKHIELRPGQQIDTNAKHIIAIHSCNEFMCKSSSLLIALFNKDSESNLKICDNPVLRTMGYAILHDTNIWMMNPLNYDIVKINQKFIGTPIKEVLQNYRKTENKLNVHRYN